MLTELRIKNFAIIDNVTAGFEPGLNVITGETGAGKSIIVDAFGLTLGDRSQPDLIRTGANETIVEAFFDVPANPLLDRLNIESGNGIIIRRVLSSSGKSRAYINDAMVNVQSLAELGYSLVDIHGQHDHQSLLSADKQRMLLDEYGKLSEERLSLAKTFHEAQILRNEISAINMALKEKAHRTEFLRFQIEDIDSASLKAGEKEALEEERSILMNLARLNELTDIAYSALYSGDHAVSGELSTVISSLKEVSAIDHSAGEVLSMLEAARPLIEDAVSSLRNYRDRYDIDPERLNDIEDRLETIKKLEKKYGGNIDAIFKHRDSAVNELQGIANSDERLGKLEKSLAEKESLLLKQARKLTGMRKKTAEKIEGSVRTILKELAMEKAEFRAEVKPSDLSSNGMDSIEFLFSANSGEPPKPLNKTASGGELSRIMLALKETLAEADKVPVLIFDEVDAGIGGRIAESVGISLKKLSQRHQVLCITHLPQIAAMADNHIVIEKIQKKNSVNVTLKKLTAGEREEEIARMLSGKITDISVKHARELLERVA